MPRLSWGAVGERYFEGGVDRGVLYVGDEAGVPWNGLLSAQEQSSSGGNKAYYVDGVKYLNIAGTEDFSLNLEALSSPVEFDVCDGTRAMANGFYATQQRRKPFGLCYRTRVGNDIDGVDHGYKLHLVYNALAQPTARAYNTINDSSETTRFSWDISTTPTSFISGVTSAHLIVDTTTAYPWVVAALEDVLYGNAEAPPRLPTPDELITIFEDGALLRVIDHGDGTFTAYGSDEVISMIDDTQFQITWPSAIYIDEDSYTITTL